MAELNIGSHCSDITCNQLDFLPIQCDSCGQVFCKLHASIGAHNCPSLTDTLITHPAKPSAKLKQPTCQFGTCIQHDLVPLICKACHGQFCIAHKQKEIHQCKGLHTATQMAEAELQHGRDRVTDHLDLSSLKEVSRPLHSPCLAPNSHKLSDRGKATAARLALIKAKMFAKPAGATAVGLPESQRFVLQLTLSDQLLATARVESSCAQPFYFSLTTPLGKVLDFAVDVFGVKRPTDGQTLKVFSLAPEKDCSQPLDLSITLKTAIAKGDIQEGDLLTLST